MNEITHQKKIRLLLINNPITALFMVAWFNQRNLKSNNNWQTVPIYTLVDFDENYSLNIEMKKQIYKEACRQVVKIITENWFVCMASKDDIGVSFKKSTPKALLNERQRRKKHLFNIKQSLIEADISIENVREIWYGNNKNGGYFFQLCPHAKIFQFEHGLSDVKNAIQYKRGFFQQVHQKLSSWFRKSLVIFPMSADFNRMVSILGDEIKTTNHNCPTSTIYTSEVLKVTEAVIKTNPSYSVFKNIQGNTALILLLRVKPLAKSREDNLAFFDSFENHLLEQYDNLFHKHNIKNLVIKSRFFHEEFSQEGFNNFSRLKQHYQLFFLSDYSPQNLPIEFYLTTLNPTLMLGSYSSGLFYSKKLLPQLITFSYHKWFIQYCLKNYGDVFYDLTWLEKMFHQQYETHFKHLLPNLKDLVLYDTEQ